MSEMFQLNNKNGIRVGLIKCNGKTIITPCFFATSDFGGGGTNVSRLLVYSDLFIDTNTQLLMNYYYLDINSDLEPRFDTNLIKNLSSFADISKFIQNVKKIYLTSSPKMAIDSFKFDTISSWKPISLLDSGSGNILREKIKRKGLRHENYKQVYEKLIEEYFKFSTLNKFDIIIAMDFAGKNTLKAGERKDKAYVSGVEEFSSNERNLELLNLTLNYMKNNKLNINVLAPIHGNSPQEYEQYIHNVLDLEKKNKLKFSGFAIGGLGNPNQIKKPIWNIPNHVNGKVKSAIYLMKIGSTIRSVLEKSDDDRPIHVLGSASPYNIIPLIYVGCDTFDCHSAWRRSSDGNELSKECFFDNEKIKKYEKEGRTVSFSKILVPLLYDNLEVVKENKDKYLEFININEYNYKCNCKICTKIGLDNLKILYRGNREENYYAKILIYLHNILQYDYICEKLIKLSDRSQLKKFIESLPDCQFRDNMKAVLFP